ncbi:venom protease isoform X2 [Acyrthosiphon pisum]|nr:venom protease isoform X2 [Acyrthosiphon pisum]XP_016657711.1 venom protease isoform X2 [Acyrthosiphon pisum]|eukprot:XP_016657710.1 PREDICTED: venom protease isoform X2 [Acyrthosiphon pisum]
MCVNKDNSTYYAKVRCPLENELTTNTEFSQKKITLNIDFTLSEIDEINSPSKLPSQETCGKEFQFYQYHPHEITGGIERKSAKLGATKYVVNRPWIVALGYLTLKRSSNSYTDMPKPEYEWKCGGSLISDRYVLTAAHCTIAVDHGMSCLTVVRLGHLLKIHWPKAAKPIDVTISRVIRHKEYNAQKLTNDIALLKLNNSVEFNPYIRPICLPILWHHRTNTFVESELFVTGWGSRRFEGPASKYLIEVKLRGVDNVECKMLFDLKNFVIDDRMLCAGSLTGKQDACQGDSGCPLMWKNRNQYYLVGIVSFGYKCGERGYPGGYTRVTSFIEWIEDNMD